MITLYLVFNLYISGTMDYIAPRFAHNSPLAKKLFGIDGVNRVFYGKDHISVGKKEETDWSV